VVSGTNPTLPGLNTELIGIIYNLQGSIVRVQIAYYEIMPRVWIAREHSRENATPIDLLSVAYLTKPPGPQNGPPIWRKLYDLIHDSIYIFLCIYICAHMKLIYVLYILLYVHIFMFVFLFVLDTPFCLSSSPLSLPCVIPLSAGL
jgi:hypothetical protein